MQPVLTPTTVREMRYMRQRGVTYEELGERFGVGRDTARRACTGITWCHVGGPVRRISLRGIRVLSESDVMLMRAMRHGGASFREIGRRFGVGHNYVARICRGQSRCDVGGYIDLKGAKNKCKSCGFRAWDNLCSECKRRGVR